MSPKGAERYFQTDADAQKPHKNRQVLLFLRLWSQASAE